jgi:hypothetical protein
MQCVPFATSPVAGRENQTTLAVSVLFTDVPHTLTALRHAGTLSSSLHASLRILVPVVVPYPLDLSASPIDSRYVCRRLTTLAEAGGVPTRIEIVNCRDRGEAVEKALAPHSIVVMYWRKRRFFDRTSALARKLSALGHQVVVVRSK